MWDWEKCLDPYDLEYWLDYEAQYHQGAEMMQANADLQHREAVRFRRVADTCEAMGDAMAAAAAQIQDGSDA